MSRSWIGEVAPPEWLGSGLRAGMVHNNRRELGDEFAGTKMLTAERVVTVSAENPPDCGCLVSEERTGHFGAGPVLNPRRDFIPEGERIALLYENLMYVGAPDEIRSGDLPRARVGRAESMWWVRTSLQPGWYNNRGTLVEYTFNPQYLPNETEILVTGVPNGTRLLGQMVRSDGNNYGRVVGEPVANDEGMNIQRWTLTSYIQPRAEHRTALPAPVAPDWADPTESLTHEQKIARLNERFTALTRATASKAVDEDWCSNYEDASEAMGLAESDYSKEEEQPEPVTYSVTLRLSYHISADSLDGILADRFGGRHDVRDSVDIDSNVSVTITLEDGGGDDYDWDEYDFDDALDSAGYDDYDNVEVVDWRIA